MRTTVPDGLPMLSAGRHRNPHRGACFMELASYLAGEPWSDSPACTHPVLAEVARNCNDRTSDAARPLLAMMIPDVIGLSGDDPRIAPRLALHCALVAMPVANGFQQRTLAAALLATRQVLAQLDDLDAATAARVQLALASVPDAAAWARRLAIRVGGPELQGGDRFTRNTAPEIARTAIRYVAHTDKGDADILLRGLLEGAIALVRVLQPVRVDVQPARWRAAVALTL